MEEVELRYVNFKAFILQIPNVSTLYAQAINMTSLAGFLDRLRHHKHQSNDELINEMAKVANIDLNSIDPDVKVKFVRYLTYFRKVSEL